MKIFIPTYGRVSSQPTLERLAAANIPATLVVQTREAELYAKAWGHISKILVLPERIQTISPTRQYLAEYAARRDIDKICMLDDDLIFYKRKAPTDNTTLSYSLLDCEEHELREIFQLLSDWLDIYPHCGISAREGNNHVEKEYVEVTRMMRCLAYRTDVLRDFRFDRLDIKEDFDITLQLLRAGHPNRVSFDYAHGQAKGSGATGGCSTFRDHEMMRRCSEELAALHPGLVRVVQKQTKGSFGGGTRTEVVCYWQRAYKEGLSRGE